MDVWQNVRYKQYDNILIVGTSLMSPQNDQVAAGKKQFGGSTTGSNSGDVESITRRQHDALLFATLVDSRHSYIIHCVIPTSETVQTKSANALRWLDVASCSAMAAL